MERTKEKIKSTYVTERNARAVDKALGSKVKKVKGDSSKEKRRSCIEEKGFAKDGYACIPSDPTPRRILEITGAAQLKLEGIELDVTPCTALPAEKPQKNKKRK